MQTQNNLDPPRNAALSDEELAARENFKTLWNELEPDLQHEIAAGRHPGTVLETIYRELSILHAQEWVYQRACAEVGSGQILLKRH